jgi:protein-disulfide isomerase
MAAKSGSRTVIYVVVGVVVVVAVLIGWGIAMLRNGSQSQVAGTYSTTIQGSVVVAGKQAANTVDVYEDFLCPICGRFESNSGGDLTKAINDGKIQVRYHPVAILNRATSPTGYSLRAASAAICAADAGFFPAYHKQLFADQPAEGSAGLTDQQLIDEATKAGATPPASFNQCVITGKYKLAVTNETSRAAKDASLRSPGSNGFGTPTVMVNGKKADLSDDTWLTSITK